MHKQLLSASLLSAALLLSGCAGFKANNLPEIGYDKLQPPSDARTKIFSQWKLESGYPANEAINASYKRQFDDVVAKSDCCTLVGSAAEADVVVDGKAYAEANPAAGLAATLSGFTMTVLPCWATLNVHISADVNRGDLSRAYDLRDSATMVIWLPMIVAMPFTDNPFKAEKEINENAYKNLVFRMKTDGLIK
ncbi:hypothetical protein JQX08_04985 [Pseudomonas sp. UL073]|uniref:Lipoprotein n=1 Tax=Zestomonas insulae TaxID=2809017 RepID=A0ABS2IA96_9GAMM|nr:hypothetical protein [Pseudomonas insulae]MBM7060054.1 hypothetical protein [Pseudomonas insulae]